MKRLAAGIVAALLLATPAVGAPPVWVVSDADSEMVLFGSMHILPPDVDWTPPLLDAAIRRADDLWFEIPVGAAADREGSDIAMRLGALPAGQTLTARLPHRDADLLRRTAARYDVSMALLDRLEPWLAEALLVQAALGRERGAYADYSVEKAIDRKAPPAARREAFATSAEHVAMLDGAPAAEQVASLRRTLQSLTRGAGDYNALIRAWLKGDLKWLQRNAVEPERRAAPAQFRRLVTERNARWASVLDKRLKGRGRTVVVVGMGHLVGRDGLPVRLRALGYSVKGP